MTKQTVESATMASQPAVSISAYVDDADRVLPVVVCDRCRYDLRNQPANGRCPECGEAIGRMLRAIALSDLRRPWYVVGAIGSLAIAIVCLCVAYLMNLLMSGYDAHRMDWYVILKIAMIATTTCAFVAGMFAGLGELLRSTWLKVSGAIATAGLMMATLFFFLMMFLLAIP